MKFKDSYLVGRTRRYLGMLLQRMWFRSSLYSLAAVLVALLAPVLGPYLPVPQGISLAAESVIDILDILASSMLVVTTFSLTIMVSAYATAANTVTPRATQLLIIDSVAMNTLATFLGSFLYSVVGLIGLSAGIYGDSGIWILFLATLGVILLMTLALLGWIRELANFGRVSDTIRRVEEVATDVMKNWAQLPRLGGMSYDDSPSDGEPIHAREAGYILFVDMPELEQLADKHDLNIYLLKLPGQFAYPALPLINVTGNLDDGTRKAILACINIGKERSFEQDPRFGLVVLSEIASRALSPAMNDPGTAVQVIGTGTRVMLGYVDACVEENEPRSKRVFVPGLDPQEFLDDLFKPIIRDGAAVIEVQVRVQLALQAMAFADPENFASEARSLADQALERALMAQYTESDRAYLRDVSSWAMPNAD